MPDSNITKRALAQALRELLREEPFEKISVSAICEACGMNRKSFYYHFKDKYELVEWIYDTEFIALVRDEVDTVDWELIERMCSYFAENQEFYAKTLAYEGQNSFTSYFHDLLIALNTKVAEEILPQAVASRQDVRDFIVAFYTDALAASVKRWIMDGCPQAPGDFVKLLKLCIYGLARERGAKE